MIVREVYLLKENNLIKRPLKYFVITMSLGNGCGDQIKGLEMCEH